tara:strand:+ start:491 stop:838 length:348 start_codon:yes stop_codon:yes gene_type:complete
MSSDGKLQNFSVDQAAGAVVLVLGAVASLLLVIWQSKCHCKMNLCYIFQCERRPPSEEEMKNLNDQIKDRKEKNKQDKMEKGEKEEVEHPIFSPRTPVKQSVDEPIIPRDNDDVM